MGRRSYHRFRPQISRLTLSLSTLSEFCRRLIQMLSEVYSKSMQSYEYMTTILPRFVVAILFSILFFIVFKVIQLFYPVFLIPFTIIQLFVSIIQSVIFTIIQLVVSIIQLVIFGRRNLALRRFQNYPISRRNHAICVLDFPISLLHLQSRRMAL